MTHPTSVRRSRVLLAVITLTVACLLASLACAGGNAATFRRRISRGPIIWHSGRLALSAEITVNPFCAPLAQTCWVQHPANRPRYFSTWVYLSTPPNMPWQLFKWHLVTIEVGREEG